METQHAARGEWVVSGLPMAPFELGRAQVAQGGMATMRVVPGLEKFEERGPRLGVAAETMSLEQLAFEVARKLSQRALSKQSATEPIEGRTPSLRQRSPKAVYCEP